MFSAFSIITDAILPPVSGVGAGPSLEPIRRPSTAHQRSSSFKALATSRPQSMISDVILPGSRRPLSRPATAMGERTRSRASHRNTIASSSLKRTTTIISEAEEIQSREKVYRWDGIIGARSEWDCVRRDQELWTPEGDALVHFYAQGQSRRGPSIRLAFADIEQCHCEQMLAESLVQGASAWELYLPAPRRLDRTAAFRHHLTTRNLFAWMFDRPLVGSQLGSALIELHQRLDAARDTPSQNAQDMLAYIESQGYADFRDNPDHAVGILVYAEHYRLAELWIDAFVHCAGQYEQLSECLDWPSMSLTTKALLARATCEMTVRLERASEDLSSFMEQSMTKLDLVEDVRRHLDRFRSFLHSYYVQTIGYWPPQTESNTLPKSLLRSMYTDFRGLYELLADADPTEPEWGRITSSTTNSNSTITKINVPAILRSYDRRFRHTPLPFTQPLIPENIPAEQDSFFSNMFFPNFGAPKRARIGRRAATVSSLQQATNAPTTPTSAAAPLVRAYREFERSTTLSGEERLSPAAARSARWLLIYAALQTLIDVTRAPAEVRDADDVSYPLCCQTAGTPPWSTTTQPEVAELDSVEPAIVPEPVVEAAEALGADARPAPSPVPSAVVAPLDLKAVANKRRSLIVPSTETVVLLHAPKPRRPASTGALAALEACSSDEETHVPTPTEEKSRSANARASFAGSDDVPSLSPTSGHSRHSSRSSDDDSHSEAETPRTSTENANGVFDVYFAKAGDGEAERSFDAPPSPSIYEDAVSGNKSEMDLLSAVGKPGSEELAARWRGEIGY